MIKDVLKFKILLMTNHNDNRQVSADKTLQTLLLLFFAIALSDYSTGTINLAWIIFMGMMTTCLSFLALFLAPKNPPNRYQDL